MADWPFLCGHIAETPKLVHYDPKAFDFGKKKAFPMRPQHFFTSVEKAMRVRASLLHPFPSCSVSPLLDLTHRLPT